MSHLALLEYIRALFDILCQAYPRRCDNQRGGRDQLFHKRVSVFGRSQGLVGPTSSLAECAITIFLFCAFTITFCHAGESLRFFRKDLAPAFGTNDAIDRLAGVGCFKQSAAVTLLRPLWRVLISNRLLSHLRRRRLVCGQTQNRHCAPNTYCAL